MAKKINIKCKVEGHVLTPYNQRDWLVALGIYSNQDVMVTIGKEVKPRSNPQNSYLWGAVYAAVSEATGQDAESIHAFFRDKFLKVYVDGCPIPKVRSTTELTTVEFIEYYRNVIQFAAEFLGLYIAEPGEIELWKSIEDSERKR